jgi:hypothetical protein
MTSYLLKVLNVDDEALFDSLCQKVILSKKGEHKINESHLEILKAYFGAVMDSS